MAQQAKVVKVGPGGRNNGPRPKVENPCLCDEPL